MKKATIILITAMTLSACGNGAKSKVITTDSTAVKTDSIKVDTTKVVTPFAVK
jgi:hypothetical protein